MGGLRLRLMVGALSGLLVAVIAGPATALIIIERTDRTSPNHPSLRLAEHTVQATITDRVAEVTAEFVYLNSSGRNLEGTFLFPLPREAAVDKFSLLVNGEEIAAELLDRSRARDIYEGIVRRQRDPALLEFVDRQLLQARIFPITPQDGAKVRLYYTHPVPADFGTADFVYPLSVERLGAGSGCKITITVEVRSSQNLKLVYSPTHAAGLVRLEDRIARMVCTPTTSEQQGEDFHVLYMTARDRVAANFLTCEDPDGVRYFMGMISPGLAEDKDVLPKDVVFCLDRSGSMAGEKLSQAKGALRFCLNRLSSHDRFGLIAFSSDVERFSPKLETIAARREAALFFDDLPAEGGTFIAGALETSLSMFADNERPKYLVFLTDGLPTVGTRNSDEILELAGKMNRHEVRVFTWGVGYDLNADLLNDLAAQGHGVASYVEPGQDIEVDVSHFFEKINRPVLAGCELELQGVTVTEMYPRTLPDLFAGSELIVVGRYTGGSPVTATLTGRQGNALREFVFTASFTPEHEKYGFLPKLWAARRIGFLLDDMRHHGENPEVIDEIVKLSKKHGIMTPYTAFLAAPEEPESADHVFQTRRSGVAAYAAKQPIRAGTARTRQSIKTETMKKAPTTGVDGLVLNDGGGDSPFMALRLPSDRTAPQTVGGKTFVLRGEIWTDADLLAAATAPTDTITVEAFSASYFDLLRACPTLQSFFSVGERVAVLFNGVVFMTGDQGAESFREEWRKHLGGCGQVR